MNRLIPFPHGARIFRFAWDCGHPSAIILQPFEHDFQVGELVCPDCRTTRDVPLQCGHQVKVFADERLSMRQRCPSCDMDSLVAHPGFKFQALCPPEGWAWRVTLECGHEVFMAADPGFLLTNPQHCLSCDATVVPDDWELLRRAETVKL